METACDSGSTDRSCLRARSCDQHDRANTERLYFVSPGQYPQATPRGLLRYCAYSLSTYVRHVFPLQVTWSVDFGDVPDEPLMHPQYEWDEEIGGKGTILVDPLDGMYKAWYISQPGIDYLTYNSSEVCVCVCV